MYYDVTALLTSIPVVDDAVAVIGEKLKQDTKLQGRCELPIDQIVVVLEFYLTATYFFYGSIIYRQITGSTHQLIPVSLC